MEKLFYLAQVFDGLNIVGTVFLVLSAGCLLGVILTKLIQYEPGDEEWDMMTRWSHKLAWTLAVSIMLVVFIPTKKTYLFMIGGKAVDTLVDETNIDEIPGNTIDFLNEYIKAETENIKNKNKDKDSE